MKFKILLILLLCYWGLSAQDAITISGGNISVGNNTVVSVSGGIVGENSSTISNSGIIYLTESPANASNWTNNAGNNFLSGTGEVCFNSNTEQEISGLFTTGFHKLRINNSSNTGVTLNKSCNVSGVLYLIDGNLITQSNTVIITNTDENSIQGYQQGAATPAYINGNLRRYIDSGQSTYAFPVGNDNNYYLSELLFDSQTGISYMDASFIELSNHNNNDMAVSESGVDYASVINQGVWQISPDNSSYTASYDIRTYIGNMSSLLQDNKFAILKRQNNSTSASDWTCGNCGIGIGLSLNNGEGRLAAEDYALRKDLTTFSQFGIGTVQPDSVDLGNDIAICAGDSATINAGMFTNYDWNTGDTTQNITVTQEGLYSVTVTDAFGSETSDDIYITVNPLPVFDITQVSDVSCYGCSDGAASVNVISGSPAFTYNWETGGIDYTETGLSAEEWYSVTVTDNNTCSATDSILLTQPNVFNIDITDSSHVLCYNQNNGTATVTPQGGIAPYQYQWSNGGTDSTAYNLSGNTWHYITVTDNNGTGIVLIDSVFIINPEELIVSITDSTNIQCFGDSSGSATAFGQGGVSSSGYSYQWSNGNATAQTTGLAAGETYTVTVTDDNDCQASTTVQLIQPDALGIDLVYLEDASCGQETGIISVDVTGGTGSYNYTWSGTYSGGNDSIYNLSEGSYNLTVSDDNLCSEETSFEVSETPGGTANINVVNHITCFGYEDAVAEVSVSGGTAPYDYFWDNSDAGITADSLSPGMHYVTVIDANGCEIIAGINIVEPEEIEIEATIAPVLCYGNSTGYITLNVSEGTPAYTYNWSHTSSNTSEVNNLTAGVYHVTVSDYNSCSVSETYQITQPDTVILPSLVETTNASCYGYNNGSASIEIEGGTPDYTISYNNETITENQFPLTISNLFAGNYNLQIEDANGCNTSMQISISSPAAIVNNISFEMPRCVIGDDGSITANPQGGTPGYSYELAESYDSGNYEVLANQSATGLESGVYYFKVTDSEGCINIDTVIIPINDVACIIEDEIPNAFTPNGDQYHDTWGVPDLYLYPESSIEIYNRWGDRIFSGTADSRWDGTYNGKNVASGSYIYIINFNGTIEPLQGIVTVVR